MTTPRSAHHPCPTDAPRAQHRNCPDPHLLLPTVTISVRSPTACKLSVKSGRGRRKSSWCIARCRWLDWTEDSEPANVARMKRSGIRETLHDLAHVIAAAVTACCPDTRPKICKAPTTAASIPAGATGSDAVEAATCESTHTDTTGVVVRWFSVARTERPANHGTYR